MIKINTLIVDDEQDGRETLRNFLLKYCPDIGNIREASSIREAIRCIEEELPQLVFLDINMPDENGFALFAKITEPAFHVVFVTAYDEYALKAIKHNALDYLLKPVNIDELVQAVGKARERALTRSFSQNFEALAGLLNRSNTERKITLPVTEGFLYVKISDIIRCEAEGNYTVFHFSNRSKVVVSRTLGSFEEQLGPHGFVRVHHQHLVNIHHVERYHRGRGGVVLMSDKKLIDVSQRKKDDFLKWMESRS